MQGEDVSVRTYADDGEALRTIAATAAGHRTLVFSRSRRRAEELAHLMAVPVHHSSVSSEDRDAAVQALRSGSAQCIVATASLEMGIDIGDPDDLLMALGILVRVRRNELEQVDPQRGARLVLGQQAIALARQRFIGDREELYETLRWSPTYAGLDPDFEATIDHLLVHRWLQADGDRIVLGPEGHRRFGGQRGVNDLLATFQTYAGATVVDDGGRRIGSVDWSQLDESHRPLHDLVLSGRSWTVVRVDRDDAVVTVRPGGTGKPPSWRGPMVEVERPKWEAVRDVLDSTEVPIEMDERAEGWLEAERAAWAGRLKEPVRSADGNTVVDSFCGIAVHRAALAALGAEGRAEGASCEIGAPLPVMAGRAQALLDDFDAALDTEATRVAPQLRVRYPELVAPTVLLAEARRFHVDAHGLHRFLSLLAGS